MKVLVCGGRDFRDAVFMRDALDDYNMDYGFSEVIHGGQMSFDPNTGEKWGADYLAGEWAKDISLPVRVFPANWKKYGKSAGHIRNAQMLAEGRPDLVIAFPGGRGTADMVRKAKKAGIQVIEVPR